MCRKSFYDPSPTFILWTICCEQCRECSRVAGCYANHLHNIRPQFTGADTCNSRQNFVHRKQENSVVKYKQWTVVNIAFMRSFGQILLAKNQHDSLLASCVCGWRLETCILNICQQKISSPSLRPPASTHPVAPLGPTGVDTMDTMDTQEVVA